jgi:hypothetical protein
MLKVIRPKFSIKEFIEAWAERKGYECSPSYQTGDGLKLSIYKNIKKQGWFWGEYTSSERVVEFYFYAKIGKKVAESIEENCEGKKLYWLKAKPAYFNMVEVLAEEIETELEPEDKGNKIILVTMEK